MASITLVSNIVPDEERILPVVLRLVLQGAKVDVVAAWVVSGIIGGIAGLLAEGPFTGGIKSWSSSSTSMSTEDLVDVGLKMERRNRYSRYGLYAELYDERISSCPIRINDGKENICPRYRHWLNGSDDRFPFLFFTRSIGIDEDLFLHLLDSRVTVILWFLWKETLFDNIEIVTYVEVDFRVPNIIFLSWFRFSDITFRSFIPSYIHARYEAENIDRKSWY